MTRLSRSVAQFLRSLLTRKHQSPKSLRRLAKRVSRFEQCESRRVLASILLDMPGMNGDTTVAGATTTDMELRSFQWGFSRGEDGARSKLTDPIQFTDLTFQRTTDSASNSLYAQSALQVIDAKPAKLRVVDNGVNLLKFDLGSTRVTSFLAKQDLQETGSLSFGSVVFTESLTPTLRTASWDLLTGAASSSAIVGPGNVDVKPGDDGPLNIETVMEIGSQKLLINDFSWDAGFDVDMTLSNPLLSEASSSNFRIKRGVDSATAGLLGAAASGTTFPEIKITDRSLIAGKNRVSMEWKLYDAFFADFQLSADTISEPKNDLQLSYGRIELIVHQFGATGDITNTETTSWDTTGNVVASTNDFGIPNPALVDNTSNTVISSLNFGTSTSSVTALGKLAYAQIDWATSNSKGTASPTQFDPMTVSLATDQLAPAPALLGQLAKRSQLATVNTFEKNTQDPTASLNTFVLNNTYVTSFRIKSIGLAEPDVDVALQFRSYAETFTNRTTPAAPITTRADFNVQTQASTSVLSFGRQNIDSEFELVIAEAGVTTSKIPVKSAQWSVARSATIGPQGQPDASAATQSQFVVEVMRGVYSPGLLSASMRGTEIDSVSLVRYSGTGSNRVKLYTWNLSNLFLEEVQLHLQPGNSTTEVDRISMLPQTVELKVPSMTDLGTEVVVTWDSAQNSTRSNAVEDLNELTLGDPRLRFRFNNVAEGIPIDSFQWQAGLPVGDTTSSGVRPLGNPAPGLLRLQTNHRPSPTLLAAALEGESLTHKISLPETSTSPRQYYELQLDSALVTGYAYADAIGAALPDTNVTIFVGSQAALKVNPLNSNGSPGTERSVSWNVVNDTTSNFSGLGGFQFPANQLPQTTLEIFDGTARSQLAATEYAFGIVNKLNQLVGESTANVSLATRGNATPSNFEILADFDAASPGLINAIARKTLIPEIKITERRSLVSGGPLLPYREWVLTNVYVENWSDGASAASPRGQVRLSLNAASAKSTYIKYDAAGVPTTNDKTLNFVVPPTVSALGTIAAVSTDPDRTIDTASRFADRQESGAKLRYSLDIVSGANLFDGVSLNSLNRLVLNYKPGQSGLAQIRITALNAFGLVNSLLLNVAVDVDGITQAPAGTDRNQQMYEDLTYTIKSADFGFTDPNDFPANSFTAVKIASLPAKGSLRLNNVPVTVNQVIPIADITANKLRFTPAPNDQGNNYTSFTFQVQDNGAGANIDLTPNLYTFNVINFNDAPTLTVGSLVMPAVLEDSVHHNGMLVSEIANSIDDIDPGALKGIAILDAPTTIGVWQYTLDGTEWLDLTGVTLNSMRLLAADATTRVRLLPNANISGTSTLKVHAWDRTIGQAGGIGSLIEFAQYKTFSTTSMNLNVPVRPVNDAPIMTIQSVDLPQIDEDNSNPIGVAISALVGGITDVDVNARKGIAVFEASTTGGRWQYSLTNGESWNDFNSVSITAARLLRDVSTVRVRFLPNANAVSEGRLRFFAWDQTQGTNGGTIDLSGVSTTGGTTAFSGEFATATQSIRSLNDAPEITAPVSQSLTLDTPLVFSTANGNALKVVDVDAGTTAALVTISATGGSLTLSTTTGLPFVAGANGDAEYTFRGRISSINAALNGAVFTPTGRFFGNASLTIVVNDQGGTGLGGPLVTSKTIALPVGLPIETIDLGPLTTSSPTAYYSGSYPAITLVPAFFTFTLASTADVRANLSGLSADLDVFVTNSAGEQIGASLLSSNAIENLLMSGLPAGTYLVAIGGQASAFTLTLSTATAFDDSITQSIALTSPAGAFPTVRQPTTASPSDLQDYYAFSLLEASALRLNLSGMSQDLGIELLDSVGRVIQSSDTTGLSIENLLTSTLAAGLYHLRVFSTGGLLTTNYDLTMTINTTSDDLLTGATSFGLLSSKGSERRTGSVALNSNTQDYYVFAAGGDLAVSVSGLSSDIDLELLDQFGRVVASSTNSSNGAESLSVPGISGTYYLRVFAFTGASSYVLEARANSNAANADDLLSTATPLPNPLTSTTQTGSIGGVFSHSDPQDYYRVELSSTKNLLITLTGLTADLDVQLLDQFGNLIAISQNGGSTNESINISLGAGLYYIRIFPFVATSVSNYSLGVTAS